VDVQRPVRNRLEPVWAEDLVPGRHELGVGRVEGDAEEAPR
jgi:hypothetical protein